MKVNKELLQHVSKKTFFEYINMFPVLKQEKTKKYTTLILTFITLSIFAMFAIGPTLSTITVLEKQVQDARAVETAIRKKRIDLTTLQNKYNALGTDLQLIADALPQDAQSPHVLGQIETIGRSSVSLDVLSSSQAQIAGIGVIETTINFNMNGSGSHEQISNLLHNLTTFDRIITIDSISLSKDTANESTQGETFSLHGKGYFSP
ncbi:MAG: type 4a pilus biogenesis protein PilO [Candidatus Levybacteria bacterium]|nr:type 4a pilus biogenesis protein PilO [Candidatus Levybacteria bacterium]